MKVENKDRIFFSVIAQAFYEASHPSIPDDVIEVDHENHIRLLAGMNDNERRVYIHDGQLTLSERKPSQWHTWTGEVWFISPEDAARINTDEAERKKLSLKIKADAEISWRQDAVDAEIATDEEVAYLAKWKKYRVLLMRVDTSDPQWPAMPE